MPILKPIARVRLRRGAQPRVRLQITIQILHSPKSGAFNKSAEKLFIWAILSSSAFFGVFPPR